MLFRTNSRLLLKNLGRIYLYIGGVVALLFTLILAGGFAMAYLDGRPLMESLYLALITGLTVGYGDLAPVTPLSKLIAILIGFLGIVFTGIVVAASLKALEMTINEQMGSDE